MVGQLFAENTACHPLTFFKFLIETKRTKDICGSWPSPDEITAEDEAQNEDKDARSKDDHVNVERQVLEGDGRHGARLVRVNQSQTTEAP